MNPIPQDHMADTVSADVQRQAARTAQETFARVFRISLGEAEAGPDSAEMVAMLGNWAAAGGSDEARTLRLALLISGLDQWGLAFSRAFGLVAIPALSELLGVLRTRLDARDDARFGQHYATLDEDEASAIDFKIALRRDIHLALWHAMIASEEAADAERVLETLGSLLLTLVTKMPTLGWRLAADALAHIQIRCLADGLASDGLARDCNERLFASLAHALPPEQWRAIMAQSTQVVLGWQQSRRPN